MKIIKTSFVFKASDGNLPCRYELVEKDSYYSVQMSGWNGKEWIKYIPVQWISSTMDVKQLVLSPKTPEDLQEGHAVLRECIERKLKSLAICDYEFSYTKEPPQ